LLPLLPRLAGTRPRFPRLTGGPLHPGARSPLPPTAAGRDTQNKLRTAEAGAIPTLVAMMACHDGSHELQQAAASALRREPGRAAPPSLQHLRTCSPGPAGGLAISPACQSGGHPRWRAPHDPPPLMLRRAPMPAHPNLATAHSTPCSSRPPAATSRATARRRSVRLWRRARCLCCATCCCRAAPPAWAAARPPPGPSPTLPAPPTFEPRSGEGQPLLGTAYRRPGASFSAA
jgi:hypothetical protein